MTTKKKKNWCQEKYGLKKQKSCGPCVVPVFREGVGYFVVGYFVLQQAKQTQPNPIKVADV